LNFILPYSLPQSRQSRRATYGRELPVIAPSKSMTAFGERMRRHPTEAVSKRMKKSFETIISPHAYEKTVAS